MRILGPESMSRSVSPLAGFQVTIIGRFWVTTEDRPAFATFRLRANSPSGDPLCAPHPPEAPLNQVILIISAGFAQSSGNVSQPEDLLVRKATEQFITLGESLLGLQEGPTGLDQVLSQQDLILLLADGQQVLLPHPWMR